MESLKQYQLEHYRLVHRAEDTSTFGNSQLAPELWIPGFELYSTQGVATRLGPLKSYFYRLGVTITGTATVDLGLETFHHRRGTVSCTAINQVFSLYDLSADFSGYYLLFTPAFWLEGGTPPQQPENEYPFFHPAGQHFLQLADAELDRVMELLLHLNEELQQPRPQREAAVRLYLSLLLLECKRSYVRQQEAGTPVLPSDKHRLVEQFKRLVGQHALTKKHVADYAQLLAVTPSYLNRVVKEHTGQTALESIQYMRLLEAKTRLRHTQQSVAEVAYELGFNDPAAFHRFFRRLTGQTPLHFRQHPG